MEEAFASAGHCAKVYDFKILTRKIWNPTFDFDFLNYNLIKYVIEGSSARIVWPITLCTYIKIYCVQLLKAK